MISTTGRTLQQVINELTEVLEKQGLRCTLGEGPCAYADDHGNHCAVGWLLPADDYRLMGFEGNVDTLLSSRLWQESYFENKSFIEDNKVLLKTMQRIHDEGTGSLPAWLKDEIEVVQERLGIDLSEYTRVCQENSLNR